jgi:mannose-6-phosphate isomerase
VLGVEVQAAGEWPEMRSVPDALVLGKIQFGSAPARPQRRSHVAGLFTTVTRLLTCDHFIIEKVRFVEGVEEAVPYDQPVVWIVLDGQAEIRVDGLKAPVGFGKGDTLLIPAEMKNPVIKTLASCVWLEVTFPKRPA